MSIGNLEEKTRKTAEELAKALRSGLELRWPLPSPPLEKSATAFPPQGNVRPFLERYADSLHFSPPRRRGLLPHVARLIRRVLRYFLSPWLRVQTLFNRSAVSAIEHVDRRVQTLEEAERSLRQAIGELERIVLAGTECERNRRAETREAA